MRIANPNETKAFDETRTDNNGRTEWGIRHTEDGTKEWVHIPTGKSNHTYYQPEVVLDPTGCAHVFIITDIGKREVRCDGCGFETSFHVGRNFYETEGKMEISIKDKRYEVINRRID